MGKIKQGIYGAISGKVGNLTGGSWKGIAYMRILPASVANPQTAAQTGQRTKFATVQALASAILVQIVKPLWDRFAQKMSGFNSFIQQNIAQVSDVGVVTWANIRTSIGSLTGVGGLGIAAADGQPTLDVTWIRNGGEGSASNSDITFCAALNETTGEWAFSEGGSRFDQLAQPVFSVDLEVGDVIHAYLSFKRQDGTMVTNSQYQTLEIV